MLQRLSPRVPRLLDLGCTLVAFVVPFLVYANSASIDPGSWDIAEMQGVPYLLGIAHPTGFPLYTMLGWLFSHLVPISTVAYRMNLFAGLTTVAAIMFAYLIAREFRVPRFMALLCVLWFATSHIIWLHASRAEVHDLALALMAGSVLYAVRWIRTPVRPTLFACIAFYALALAVHPIAIWLTPGIITAMVMRRSALARTDIVKSALIVVAGLSLYLYLPIRSAVVVAYGLDPTATLQGLNGGIFWNYNDPHTLSGLVTEVLGSQFGAQGTLLTALDPRRFPIDVWNWLTLVASTYGVIIIPLASFGAWRLWRSHRDATIVMLVLCLAALPFSYAYSAEGDPDRYRMLSLLFVAVLASAASLGLETRRLRLPLLGVGVLTLCFAVATYRSNTATYNYHGHNGQRSFIAHINALIPRDSLVLAGWVDATTLAYGAYVDDTFSGHIVVPINDPANSVYYGSWASMHPLYSIEKPLPYLQATSFRPICRIDDVHYLFKFRHFEPLRMTFVPPHLETLAYCMRRIGRDGEVLEPAEGDR